MENICFMFGHHDVCEEILSELESAIELHYTEYGTRVFVVGGYGAFDRLAAIAAVGAKKRHGDLRLFLLTPYHPSCRKVSVPEGFDGTWYPEGLENVPYRYAIVKANRIMVRNARSIICWVRWAGNAEKLLRFAQTGEKTGRIKIRNIAATKNTRQDPD